VEGFFSSRASYLDHSHKGRRNQKMKGKRKQKNWQSLYQEDLMCVSQNNNRIFIAIVLGMFLASGCSGHSVKYGANSEGEGLASEGEMVSSVDGAGYGTTRNADGSTMYGGTVNGNNPSPHSDQGTTIASSEEMSAVEGSSFVPENGSNYGSQFGGVDGSGPNHGGVTGLGSGSANPSNPEPEKWANAYLQEKRSSQEFYGDPSASGSSYGHDYDGVPGSGPHHGAVDGFGQGSAPRTEANPDKWAQAYLKENGGPSPEYVNPDMSIAQARGHSDSRLMGMGDSKGEFLETRNTSSGFEGRVQDIYFAFDSWSISAEAAKYLEEDAKWLHANPEKALTIEGHCDQRGTQDYNLVLGKKRAEAAREYLVNLGIQPHRISIVSYGKERPFCQNNNENCFKENRRNHMVVRMNQS
jgi:peptidoglycan-associated lipoprotein